MSDPRTRPWRVLGIEEQHYPGQTPAAPRTGEPGPGPALPVDGTPSLLGSFLRCQAECVVAQ